MSSCWFRVHARPPFARSTDHRWMEPTEAREARSVDRQKEKNNLRACPWRWDRPAAPICSLFACAPLFTVTFIVLEDCERTCRDVQESVDRNGLPLTFTASSSFSHRINLYSYTVYNFADFYQPSRRILATRVANM